MADQRLHAPGATTLPRVSFQTKLEGTFYRFRLRWQPRGKFWTLDTLTASGVVLFQGHRVTEGADVFGPYCRAEFPPGQLFARDAEGLWREPTRYAWRNTHDLIYRPAADVETAAGTAREVR